MKHFVSITIFSLVFLITSNAQTTIYTNDMDYVLGDVKQAFITNKITTQAKADKLITGLKNLKVNGVRIPIYAEGLNPNKAMFDYFYTRVVAEGFPIFANPAQGIGGQRIACGVLNEQVSPVKDDEGVTNCLIKRIKDFASEYKCMWINPFNEDGQAGAAWSADQMNTIYESLFNNVNGAELVGPCVWGIPASIQVMKGTKIRDYITVATTHNLGFNHGQWDSFISLADAKNLPVWDSEVNHYDKYDTGTRLEKAIEAKVDGLVMYNIWNNIDLTSGSVKASGKEMMDLYLKEESTPLDKTTTSQVMFPTQINSAIPTFKPINSSGVASGYTLKIYSLTGKLVFTTMDMEDGWSPKGQANGIYIYKVHYVDADRQLKQFSGKVISHVY